MEQRKIAAFYPFLIPSEKVFIDDNIISLKKDSESKDIIFKDISGIVVQPLAWIRFLYRTNDIIVKTKNGEDIKLFNITNYGLDEIITKTKKFNPAVSVERLSLKAEVLINGLIRTRDTADGKQVSSKVAYIILAVVVILFLLFVYKFASNSF